MQDGLKILKVAGAMARHASASHATVARNLANANTPDYKAREIGAFDMEAVLRKGAAAPRLEPRVIADIPASPNGNTVMLEDQIVRATEAQIQHDAALGIYRKTMDLMKISLGR